MNIEKIYENKLVMGTQPVVRLTLHVCLCSVPYCLCVLLPGAVTAAGEALGGQPDVRR